MNKIQNIERVEKIKMYPKAHVKCQIGQDWYGCDFEVTFIPDGSYPDYMEIQKFVSSNIDGMELNIEQAARILCDKLFEYDPIFVSVKNHVENCKTHFNVDVTVSSYREE